MTSTLARPTATKPVPDEDVQALLEVDDEEFDDILTEALMDANGPTSQEPDWQCLFASQVIGRTSKALGQLNLRVQIQLGETSAKMYTERLPRRDLANVRKVRGGLLLFRSRLIARSAEARDIRRQLHLARNGAPLGEQPANPKPTRDEHAEQMEQRAREARDTIRILALAIHRHRLDSLTAGLTPEPADRALWAVLDETRIPLRKDLVTLTEMIGTGSWTDERP